MWVDGDMRVQLQRFSRSTNSNESTRPHNLTAHNWTNHGMMLSKKFDCIRCMRTDSWGACAGTDVWTMSIRGTYGKNLVY